MFEEGGFYDRCGMRNLEYARSIIGKCGGVSSFRFSEGGRKILDIRLVDWTDTSIIRIDKKEHNNKIDDEILAEIRRSRFLIADFTCEPKNVRGGVYYEAGFAQGLGIPVIWTCRETSLADLHFDTRQYSHIVWKTPADLFTQLKNRIGATIGDGPLPKV
jgi:hypothetical protein